MLSIEDYGIEVPIPFDIAPPNSWEYKSDGKIHILKLRKPECRTIKGIISSYRGSIGARHFYGKIEVDDIGYDFHSSSTDMPSTRFDINITAPMTKKECQIENKRSKEDGFSMLHKVGDRSSRIPTFSLCKARILEEFKRLFGHDSRWKFAWSSGWGIESEEPQESDFPAEF